MSLTGNLEVFPLEEVLRLLARSKKTGSLRVEGPGIQGRIFLANGSLTLATVGADEDLRRQIVNAGLVGEDELRRAEGTEVSLTEMLAPGVSAAAVTDFVREQVVESLYRIRKPGRGSFDFAVDLRPRYVTGQSFDVEVALSEADRRASEWADIETAVTDLHAPIVMARELPDENNVTIAPPTWRVLASLESGASVVELADILGLSEFRAAREVAGLFRNRLVEYRRAPAPAAAPAPEQTWTGQEQPVEPPAQAWETGAWQQHEEPAAPAEPEPQPEAGGWWAQAMESEPSPEPAQASAPEVHQEPDTDGFLESVFSQLDDGDEQPTEGDEEETGFSMGLLRRRRMGAVARDITDAQD